MRTQYAPTARQNRGRRARKSADVNWPLAVADGRIALGTIDKIDEILVAIDHRGTILGKFEDLRSAVRAFPDASSAANRQPSLNRIQACRAPVLTGST